MQSASRSFPVDKVVLGADHGGFELKQVIAAHLRSQGLQVLDVGTHDTASVDYPDIAKLVCEKIASNEYPAGVVFCGTGIGISIACNKHPGIRCALCHDHYTAMMCRQHNDANILALGGRTTGVETAKDIVTTFLETAFVGAHHTARVHKIHALEKGHC